MSQNAENTIARGDHRLVLDVKPGFHLSQVVALMNRFEARVEGRQVIAYPESASDGFYVLADIVDDTPGYEVGEWARLGSETRPGGKCANCTCSCSCTAANGCCKR